VTGAGRTGKYLAAEHWGINPDIIALAKGLGAGYVPLGAMLAHERIVEPVLDSGGFQHGYTYAGNPLACAAGLAAIDEILARDPMGNTAAIGDHAGGGAAVAVHSAALSCRAGREFSQPISMCVFSHCRRDARLGTMPKRSIADVPGRIAANCQRNSAARTVDSSRY
jgi:hypothetical protein